MPDREKVYFNFYLKQKDGHNTSSLPACANASLSSPCASLQIDVTKFAFSPLLPAC